MSRVVPRRRVASLAGVIALASVVADPVAALAPGVRDGSADASAWLPPGIHVSPVVDGRIDGRIARVHAVRVPADCPSVAAAVRAFWQPAGTAPVLEGQAGSWQTLTALRDGELRVLQIRASSEGGCAGLLTSWPSTGAVAPRDLAGWPAELRVVRRLEGGDGSRRDLTVVATTSLPPAKALASVERFLAPAGLRLRQDGAPAGGGSAAAGVAYTARSLDARASLYLEARGASTHLVLIVQGVGS